MNPWMAAAFFVFAGCSLQPVQKQVAKEIPADSNASSPGTIKPEKEIMRANQKKPTAPSPVSPAPALPGE